MIADYSRISRITETSELNSDTAAVRSEALKRFWSFSIPMAMYASISVSFGTTPITRMIRRSRNSYPPSAIMFMKTRGFMPSAPIRPKYRYGPIATPLPQCIDSRCGRSPNGRPTPGRRTTSSRPCHGFLYIGPHYGATTGSNCCCDQGRFPRNSLQASPFGALQAHLELLTRARRTAWPRPKAP